MTTPPPSCPLTVLHTPNPAKRRRLAALVDRLIANSQPVPEQARERQTAQKTA